MRICVCGAGGVGKSTFIEDFLTEWPSYSSSGETYRELIKEKKLTLNKDCTQDSQKVILDCLLDEAMRYTAEDNVVHDRGTLDNLVYTLWAKAKNDEAIDEVYLQKAFQLVKESMCFYDVIFYIPYNDQYMTEEVREHRETDKEFNQEIDNFFKVINGMYYEKNQYLFPFNSEEGVPALIEIFGDRQERLEIAKLYIAPDGENYGEDASLVAEFLESGELTEIIDPKA